MTKADDITWLLEGPVFVGNDADATTLTVEAGVTVYASTAVQDTLLCVTRGAKLEAEGAADAPIVFTPDNDTGVRGQWGGLIINGKSHLNKSGGVAQGEGNTGEYGGGATPDLEDNSGTLKYVRVEYAGRLLTTEDELNGIALQAVGSGTTVDYVQVHMNKDDGSEWFGGTVNVKHILVTGIADDSFDWTAGWTGKGQFMIAQQYADAGDRMIEADNSGSSNDALPRSQPTLSNLTLVGQGLDGAGDTGILLREGTAANISNAVPAQAPISSLWVIGVALSSCSRSSRLSLRRTACSSRTTLALANSYVAPFNSAVTAQPPLPISVRTPLALTPKSDITGLPPSNELSSAAPLADGGATTADTVAGCASYSRLPFMSTFSGLMSWCSTPFECR